MVGSGYAATDHIDNQALCQYGLGVSATRKASPPMDATEDYYTKSVASCPGAPPFSPESEKYVNYLPMLEIGETWEHFTKRVGYSHDQANRGTDILTAIYPQDPTENSKRFHGGEQDEQDRLDTAFTNARNLYPATSDVPHAVFRAFARLTPVWASVPVNHDPNVADFVWCRVRAVIASAGHEHHADLAKILGSLYPQCPLLPAETKQEWDAALVDAHRNSGYPAHLACVPWNSLVRALKQRETKLSMTEEWHRAVALLHVLKHVRRVEGEQSVVVTFDGVANHIELDSSSVLGQQLTVTSGITRSLGCPPSSKAKHSHPLTDAVTWALGKLSPSQLLLRRSLTHLPGSVLRGGWSSTEPDPQSRTNFVQHGLRLSGVWVASQGKVEEHYGDDSDILDYNWNIINPFDFDRSKGRLEEIIPKTYSVAFPSDTFFSLFPNIETAWSDLDAIKAIFDSPIFASLLRPDMRELEREYPLVAFLPQTPEIEQTSNQGKTMAALTYARILVPSLKVTGSSETSSAPEIRAVCSTIRSAGTLCLDEFRMPKTKSHPLCRENLQLMCTGGDVTAGKVLDNEESNVQLRHSLVCSAKALDFPPDLMNRTFAFYLGDLDDSMRDSPRIAKLEDGSLALQMRLGAIALAEKSQLADHLRALLPHVQGSKFRFQAHRILAKLLYMMRTGRPEKGEIDKAWVDMSVRFAHHTKDAEDSGVLTSLETGTNLRLRLTSFFDGMTEMDLQTMAAYILQTGYSLGSNTNTWVSTLGLLRARAIPAGLSGRGLHQLLPHISSSRGFYGDRQIGMVLIEEIRRLLPANTCWQLPGHLGVAGWVLWRKDNANAPCMRLEKLTPAQMAGTAAVGAAAPGSVILSGG